MQIPCQRESRSFLGEAVPNCPQTERSSSDIGRRSFTDDVNFLASEGSNYGLINQGFAELSASNKEDDERTFYSYFKALIGSVRVARPA